MNCMKNKKFFIIIFNWKETINSYTRSLKIWNWLKELTQHLNNLRNLIDNESIYKCLWEIYGIFEDIDFETTSNRINKICGMVLETIDDEIKYFYKLISKEQI